MNGAAACLFIATEDAASFVQRPWLISARSPMLQRAIKAGYGELHALCTELRTGNE